MGYMKLHAIIVTTFCERRIKEARAIAESLFNGIAGGPSPKEMELVGCVSPVVESPINGYYNFCIFPDGSKEGWSASAEGDAARKEFIEWLKGQHEDSPDDKSSVYSWAYIQYGDDNGDDRMLDSANMYINEQKRAEEDKANG